jgi:hypothetical protein
MREQGTKKKEKEFLEKTGTGLFAEVKVNADVIQVKKKEVTEEQIAEVKKTIKKQAATKNKGGIQGSLF